MLRSWTKVSWVAIASVFVSAISVPLPTKAQSPGDVVTVGNSSLQWQQMRAYWDQLLNLNGPQYRPNALEPKLDQPGQSSFDPVAQPGLDQSATNPQMLEQQLMRNLRVTGLRLNPIIKLNGSSEVLGVLTNGNRTSVTVSGVNFEVYDANGALIQTGSATPTPATIAPGQSVTFKATLLTILPDAGNRVRLARNPFVLQGGV